jgi:uroporphyrinogen III methyltransferase/synthase
MGVKNLPAIVDRLQAHGKPPDTPMALVRWGTTPQQVTVVGTLGNIVERAKAAGLKAPAIIIVGDVVNLRSSLKWFEIRPLMGKRIVVTRAREQASELIKLLSDLGAECLEYPTIKVVLPAKEAPLNLAVQNLAAYDWIVFTSINGVSFFFKRLFAAGKDVRALGRIRTAAIGPATAKRLADFGLFSDIVPDTYRAESVVEAFRKEDIGGKMILLPRAQEARPVLPAELRKMGAEVDEVTVYVTEPVRDNVDQLLEQLENKAIDLITFTSSSTVKNFKKLIPSADFNRLLDGVAAAAIGPITAETAKNLGFEVHIVADSYTIPGLCEAILQYFRK